MNLLKELGKEFNIYQLKLKLFITLKEKNILLDKEGGILKVDIPVEVKFKTFQQLTKHIKPNPHIKLSTQIHNMVPHQRHSLQLLLWLIKPIKVLFLLKQLIKWLVHPHSMEITQGDNLTIMEVIQIILHLFSSKMEITLHTQLIYDTNDFTNIINHFSYV
jgi:hypothetical protein